MKKSTGRKMSALLENNKSLFNELLDVFDESGFEGIRLKGPRISGQKAENFELLNLLEYENQRLQKTDHFFNVKLPNETDHEVMEKILIQQQHSSNRKKDLLVKKFIVTNSPVNISMKKIFNQAFRKE
jgi:flagellar biosynthesis/type III secretory pathway chaperone